MISQKTIDLRHLTCLLAVVILVTGCSWDPPKPDAQSSSSIPQTSRGGHDTVGQRAADIAVQQIGVPYSYGGNTPRGFDCSGLVQYSYSQVGKNVPRTTTQLWQRAVPVSRTELQAGDILFFDIAGKISHVGLYLGDQRFVHAPSSGKTVTVASLQSDYYRGVFVRAGRL